LRGLDLNQRPSGYEPDEPLTDMGFIWILMTFYGFRLVVWLVFFLKSFGVLRYVLGVS